MSQCVLVDREVMVLGGAPEAGWAVRELLGLGYRVHWVAPEAESAVGALSTYTEASLAGLQGQAGRFQAILQGNGDEQAVPVAAVVVATGNERYIPAEAPVPLGGPVCSLSQMAQRLAHGPARTCSSTQGPRATPPNVRQAPHRYERVALLLDAGQDTSKELACEAMRLASRLRSEWFCEVWVLYRDLRVDSQGLEALTRSMRQQGIIFSRYDDLEVTVGEAGATLAYLEGPLQVEHLVVPEAIRPAPGTAELAARLRVRLGEDGFFQDANIHQLRLGLSSRRGVVFAGRCHMDGDEAELRGDADQAAANVDALLRQGYLQPEAVIAEVDPDECIRCLTCVRTCPHAAIDIALYPERETTAALVAELACQGCGACVVNCPVQAIKLQGQALPAWAESR